MCKAFTTYCNSRTTTANQTLTIAYRHNDIIRYVPCFIAMRANIKGCDCLVLASGDDDDFGAMHYLKVSDWNDCGEHIAADILSECEYRQYIKQLNTLNLFEFTSLCRFSVIYSDYLHYVLQQMSQHTVRQLFT